MTATVTPSTTGHMPFFITSPGQTDSLLVAMAVFLLLAVLGIGVVYFRLHALPEHIAHGANKIQFQIVAVLTLLALFTHNHAFWIAGLLLALVPIPDFHTPFVSISKSLDRIAAKATATETREAADMPAETTVAQVIALPQTKPERSTPPSQLKSGDWADKPAESKSRDRGD
jgi:hypothetical protein